MVNMRNDPKSKYSKAHPSPLQCQEFSNYNILEKDLFRLSMRLFEDDDIKPAEISVLTRGELQILTSLLKRKFDIILNPSVLKDPADFTKI